MNRLRAKLTYANVVSTLCLFLLLGGAAYAASQLPKNSVGAKQIKRGAITPAKLAAATKRAFAPVTGPQGPPGAAGATKVVVRIGKQEKGSEVLCKPGEAAISGGGIISDSGALLYGSLPVDSKHETTLEGKAPEGWFAGGEARRRRRSRNDRLRRLRLSLIAGIPLRGFEPRFPD